MEAHDLLRQLSAVDTSHGRETDALKPLAAEMERAGLHPEIFESSPSRGNLVVRVPRRDGATKKPLLLLAHIDVVPVEGQPWTAPAFPSSEKDGFLWGRGVADDKSMAAAFAAIALDLARTKAPLERDVIVALTAGEETGGFAGVQWLLKNKRPLIDAEFALNEGGPMITSKDFATIQIAGISVAEKSYQSYRLVARGGGGHSSTPKPGEDPVLELGRALVKIGEFRFPAKVLPETKEWFNAAVAWETPAMATALGHAAASAPKLLDEDERVLGADRSYNALVRTTCVTTMLQGSPQDNVLPTSAEATVNCRILPDETREATRDALVQAIGNPKIEVTPVADYGVGPSSPLDGEVPRAIEAAAHAAFPEAKVVRTMSSGATDSRHLRQVGIPSYGLSCAPTSLEEVRLGRGAHGPDERRPLRWLGPGARYARDIVLRLVTDTPPAH